MTLDVKKVIIWCVTLALLVVLFFLFQRPADTEKTESSFLTPSDAFAEVLAAHKELIIL